ncbi:flagellar hook capping FlgD N-terminal domain-containing protein [Zoogloea sp. LCSB751]|uniref:flagellar hook capping FlgD N-terminal domain-containing protein n=1 Tax=Zoogloea sp. LCSB751 TaxID=1965277 RepID=UPI0009A4A39C|nr:flagellar hook capping FlgD N-terminal domain-containing protein [Zoogloea sp. LCSB751]
MSAVFNASTGATGASADSTAVKSNGLGVSDDMFMTLLVAQIKNQDPLNPQDASQFVTQLSQLSQTSALQSLVSQGKSAATQMDSLQTLLLGARVGSDVAVRSDSVELGAQTLNGRFELASGSSATNLVLTDSLGQTHSVALGSRGVGINTFSLDPASLGLAPGRYAIAVKTDGGETPAVDITGKLESVRVSGSAGVVLKVANVGEIGSSAITGFNSPTG